MLIKSSYGTHITFSTFLSSFVDYVKVLNLFFIVIVCSNKNVNDTRYIMSKEAYSTEDEANTVLDEWMKNKFRVSTSIIDMTSPEWNVFIPPENKL